MKYSSLLVLNFLLFVPAVLYGQAHLHWLSYFGEETGSFGEVTP